MKLRLKAVSPLSWPWKNLPVGPSSILTQGLKVNTSQMTNHSHRTFWQPQVPWTTKSIGVCKQPAASLCSPYRTVVSYRHQNIHSRTCLLKFGRIIHPDTKLKPFCNWRSDWRKSGAQTSMMLPVLSERRIKKNKIIWNLKQTKTTGVFGNHLRNQQAYHGEKVIENPHLPRQGTWRPTRPRLGFVCFGRVKTIE